jgi:hypothetical protein
VAWDKLSKVAPNSPLVTREDAKSSGKTRFFSGEPCKRGHIAEQYVVNRKCVECQREEMRERYWGDPGLYRARAKQYYEKPENKEKVRANSRKHKLLKPTKYYYSKRQEREAGRPRPPVCELCAKPNRNNRPIYFDHCHASGSFRGWLCHRCNTILGQVDDNAVLLRRLADYLERGLKYAKAG